MKTTTSTPESSPCLAQLKAYEELHYSTTDKFFDLRAIALSALALLDNCESSDSDEDVESARRVLTLLEINAVRLANEVYAAFADVKRGRHA